MGRYMTVFLKKEFTADEFIKTLNEELYHKYAASWEIKFNPWYDLQTIADYYNKHPEGKKWRRDWKRPVSTKWLSKNFFWFTNGVFSTKISGEPDLEDCKDAVAICKWIIATEGKFIDTEQSSNYEIEILKEYLNHIYENAGYDLEKLWKL
ncbi:hypothetical protein [Elizabethkingia anophelis]|uniref:hypothetical protein n=1 Tax=Elizabethkingia anophelis TaxID=1117645 RepID=UPI00136FB916|nr:hypothetical protein [Elizabethkingia anophelis]MYY43987.1 hypothetical protein [Elizabethkingia anophelis]